MVRNDVYIMGCLKSILLRLLSMHIFHSFFYKLPNYSNVMLIKVLLLTKCPLRKTLVLNHCFMLKMTFYLPIRHVR